MLGLSRVEAYTGPITIQRLLFAAATIYFISWGPRLIGFSRRHFYHHRKPITITLKDGTKTTFDKFCKSVIPHCRLNPFLFNGHLQTIWTAIAQHAVDIHYKRWVFENENPAFLGQYAVDFIVKSYTEVDENLPPRTTYYTKAEFDKIGSNDSKPMLILMHGLAGGSNELYLREVIGKLFGANDDWEGCVINSRGCAESNITTPMLYNARTSWDVREVVKWLRKTFPNRPLFGCGFSLGANMLTNYVGEEAENCQLKAAIVLSSPWNLEAGDKALHKTWLGHNVYSKAMGISVRDLVIKHADVLSKNPNLDMPAIRKLQHLHQFDELVQSPVFGYPNANAYYRDASSTDTSLDIRIPFLSINAEDDPIVSADALPYEEIQQNPYNVLCTTDLGGHLSWFEFGGGRWFATAAASWLQKMATDVDFDALPQPMFPTAVGYANGHANGHANGNTFKPATKAIFQGSRKRWHVPE